MAPRLRGKSPSRTSDTGGAVQEMPTYSLRNRTVTTPSRSGTASASTTVSQSARSSSKKRPSPSPNGRIQRANAVIIKNMQKLVQAGAAAREHADAAGVGLLNSVQSNEDVESPRREPVVTLSDFAASDSSEAENQTDQIVPARSNTMAVFGGLILFIVFALLLVFISPSAGSSSRIALETHLAQNNTDPSLTAKMVEAIALEQVKTANQALIKNNINSLERKVELLSKQLDNEVAALSKTGDAAKSHIGSVDSQLKELRSVVSNLQSAIQSDQNQLNSQLSQGTAGMEQLRVDVDKLETIVGRLATSENEVLQAARSQQHFQTQLSSLSETIKTLGDTINHQAEAQTRLQSSSQNEMKRVDELQKQLVNAQTTLAQISAAQQAGGNEKVVVEQAQVDYDKIVEHVVSKIKATQSDSATAPQGSSLGEDQIVKLIKEQLDIFDADKVAEPDFALLSAGAKVLGATDTYEKSEPTGGWNPFAKKLLKGNDVDTVFEAKPIVPGRCWPFKDSQGQITLQLSKVVNVTAVTLEHVSRKIAHHIDTAPKDFEVMGVYDKNSQAPVDSKDYSVRKTLVAGTYEAGVNSPSIQRFPVANKLPATDVVQFLVNSNYGAEYTCVYRIRVHGTSSS